MQVEMAQQVTHTQYKKLQLGVNQKRLTSFLFSGIILTERGGKNYGKIKIKKNGF